MRISHASPSLIYINAPPSLLAPTTDIELRLQNVLHDSLRKFGFTSCQPHHMLAVVQTILHDTQQTMPFATSSLTDLSKKQRTNVTHARESFVAHILQSIEIDFSGSVATYRYNGRAITPLTKKLMDVPFSQTWLNGIYSHLAAVLKLRELQRPVAIIATDPKCLTTDRVTPIVGLLTSDDPPNREQRLRKKSDEVIQITMESAAFTTQIKRLIDYFAQLKIREIALRASLVAGDTSLEPQFTREVWPSHPLVTHVKKTVRSVVNELIKERGVICDALDLEYQTLFRLTSLPVASVFENGNELEIYLRNHEAYNYWRNILTLDPTKVAQPVRRSIIKKLAQEQLYIIQERLQQTALPYKSLVHPEGIFAEQGWKLHKHSGKVRAIKLHPTTGEICDSREVSFKPVDPEYAKELHSTLHYIHTPRAIMAFGLYLENDPLPFSVVAFDTIDRPYKQDLLFMHGYNPRKCLDLARLYSRPGSPFNTSSTIFTLAFSYFREHKPDIQAILSAFMPTYAHGMSMISAGFNYGVLVKEWRHSFTKRTIDGHEAWELVTKRRKDDTQPTIDSQWPLLPVFELMACLQPPRFTPFSELEGMMISRDLHKKATSTSSPGSNSGTQARRSRLAINTG